MSFNSHFQSWFLISSNCHTTDYYSLKIYKLLCRTTFKLRYLVSLQISLLLGLENASLEKKGFWETRRTRLFTGRWRSFLLWDYKWNIQGLSVSKEVLFFLRGSNVLGSRLLVLNYYKQIYNGSLFLRFTTPCFSFYYPCFAFKTF